MKLQSKSLLETQRDAVEDIRRAIIIAQQIFISLKVTSKRQNTKTELRKVKGDTLTGNVSKRMLKWCHRTIASQCTQKTL